MRRWMTVWMMAMVSCGTPPSDDPGATRIRIAGSESMTETLLRALTDTYGALTPDVRFEIEGGGSRAGLEALLNGEVDVAATTRTCLPAEEEQARANGYSLDNEDARHLLAVDVVAVSVHPSNPIDSLTYDQIIGIFCTGAIDNWSYLGMESRPIRPMTLDPMSGTRALFEDFFCGPRGMAPRMEQGTVAKIRKALTNDPSAISFFSMTESAGKILGLRADPSSAAVMPSQQNIIRGAYPLYHDLYLYTAGTPSEPVEAFLDWIESPAGQEIVDETRYVPLFLRPERLDGPRPLRETVHFEPGSDAPNQRSTARIGLLTEDLRARTGEYRHVVLEGFTDNQEEDPIGLSRQRAQRVQELLGGELPGMFFEIIPRGRSNPIAPNETPYGRQRNRRVQIYLAEDEASEPVTVQKREVPEN